MIRSLTISVALLAGLALHGCHSPPAALYCHDPCATSDECSSGLSCFDTTTGSRCLPVECAGCFAAGRLCTSNITHDADGNELCAFDSCDTGTAGRMDYTGTATLTEYYCSVASPGSVTTCPVQTVAATGFVNPALTWVEIRFTHPTLHSLDSGDRCEVDPVETTDVNHYATSYTADGHFTMAGTLSGRFDETTLTGSGCTHAECTCDVANGGYNLITFDLRRTP